MKIEIIKLTVAIIALVVMLFVGYSLFKETSNSLSKPELIGSGIRKWEIDEKYVCFTYFGHGISCLRKEDK